MTFCIEARTIKHLFIEEPEQVLPLLNKGVKMDMIDYHNEGIEKYFPNAFGDSTHIISATDTYFDIQVSKSSRVQMQLYTFKKDTVIAVVTTVALPAKDSRIEFFNTSWKRLDGKNIFKAPSMKDFVIIPNGHKMRKEAVLDTIEFPIISFSINPEIGTIIARQSLKEYMSKEDYDKISPYLKPSIEVKLKLNPLLN